jgi:hypothetical protein
LAAERFRVLSPLWAAVYEQIADHYGFTLREGATWTDLENMFSVIAQGIMIRTNAAADLGVDSAGTSLATRMTELVLAQLTGLPWEELSSLTSCD